MHSQNGHYTVQSGYKAWMKAKKLESARRREGVGPSYEGTIRKVWKTLWQQKVSQKMKVFIWKCLHGGLPVRGEIYRRTRQGGPMCMGCGEKEETIEHLLFQCSRAKEIWKLSPVQWDGVQHTSDCFIKWWSAIIEAQQERGEVDQVNLTINILWQIWKSRNEREFNQKEREPHKIIQKAMKEWMEFEEANKGKLTRGNIQGTEAQQCTEQLQSQRESQTSLMIKVHSHQDVRQKMVGIGITASDLSGRLQACWAMRERMSAEPMQDQAGAVRLALLNAISQGWRNIKVELESRELVECIKNTRTSNYLMATLIEDIQYICKSFQTCSFSNVNSGFVESIKLSMHALNIFIDEAWVNPNARC
ncbi:uncharacterized protein [Coffea arabica]|uniref:Reverse transcriptase zinc-binding domain-containing protein n=1 Tax=Coffea arabica TaxID=13443 RepID=A0A6P6SPE9_COFAR|nr:uncharacterized protein LOC113693409 [Coffea arabica]